MIAYHVVTVIGETFCAVFDDEDRIILACGVEETSERPSELGSEMVNAWLCGAPEADETLTVGAWLQREYEESRATRIVASFEVWA